MAEYCISTPKFRKLIEKLLLNNASIVAPIESFGKLHIEEVTFDNISNIRLSGFRSVESFKSCFFKLSEKVSSYFGRDESAQGKELIVLGARGCDTEAIGILDQVFSEDDFQDPFYSANREKITVISADCTEAGETCFCPLVKGKPYAEKNFDLNFSWVDNGYVVEIGSDKGKKLIDNNKGLFAEVDNEAQLAKTKMRDKVMESFAQKAKMHTFKMELSEIHKKNLKNTIWKSLTKDCVECSACNFICPTCSCFLLLDQKPGKRYKAWDACLKANYAKVAGGANPRGKLYERLQNRYHCKFDYSFDRLGRYTCVGCGRCIDGCMGKINMCEVFIELEKQL